MYAIIPPIQDKSDVMKNPNQYSTMIIESM